MNTTKNEKTQMLIEYAKECYQRGHKPTKKEIRTKFHLEIYNYFKSIVDYREKAGIPRSVRNYPKEEAKEIIKTFLQKNAEKGHYPMRKEIDKELRIHVSTYFNNLREVYKTADIPYELVEENIQNNILAAHTHTPVTLNEQRKCIQTLIKQKVKEGYYPSVKYLQQNLSLSFYNLYEDIFEAYIDAGIEYERISPIILGKKKELLFTQIVKDLLQKIGFTIQRISIESENDFNRNADMTVLDKDKNKLLVEIKAYRKDYCITCREFKQLQNYLNKENIQNGLFITTSNSKKCLFDNMQFINGNSIINLLKKHNLEKHSPTIKWIQESRINSHEKQAHNTLIKNKIINYAKSQEKIPTKKEIEKKFKIDLRTYFGETKSYEKFLTVI